MRTRGRGGYTLTEMMLVVAILGIVSSAGGMIFLQVFRYFRQSQARIDIQRDARAVFDLMSRNLRQAKATTIVISNAASQPPYSQIWFTRSDGKWVKYYQQGTKLYQVTQSTTAIAENLRFITFTFPRTDDDNLLSISLTLEKATYNQETKALQLSVEKIKVHND